MCTSARTILMLTAQVVHVISLSVSVTRVRSQGHVVLNINVVTKDLWKQGYRNGAKDPPVNVHAVARETSGQAAGTIASSS